MSKAIPKTIVDTHEIAEAEWDEQSEPGDVPSMISATDGPERTPFEFHVQMRGFTMNEMENLVVEAAARLIVGNHRDAQIAQAIEDKCIELIDAKATAALDSVTTEIIDAPIAPSFGDKAPVTMREFIGLYGREYLTATVSNDGKPAKRDYYNNAVPRIEYLVAKALDGRFKMEIEKATTAAIVSIRAGIQAQHNAILAAEKKRLSDALAASLVVKD